MMETEPWWRAPVPAPDEAAAAAAAARQAELTKPPGSLGRLEWIATDLAGMQGVDCPILDRVHIAIFAADHGVAAEGVSAFPQAVTLEMVRNFARGGAAISVLARGLGAELDVIDMGTAHDDGELAGVQRVRIAAGTANFCTGPAMSVAQCRAALDAGRRVATEAAEGGAQAFLGGEMGIANTTAATAVACALLGAAPATLAGSGTGLDTSGVAHKVQVIERALEHHASTADALDILAALGGFEIAALAGAFIASAQQGLPVLVDGFITSVAALVAVREVPAVGRWLIATHRSAEPGHDRILAELELEPILDLGMRLGEGSGAAVAVPILRSACAVHAGMATFSEAGVSQG
ncbi:nicotinate-nucleotide--dimethylbenzimidazole phosphoribosyltransferase [Halofilum ochraceum]|uniref:nicotinate-nucleotide--dimethylbenzimidazole phosphoribosyltransferase n=1 Tax=Halofilum ochraceum TaxID=1611323 RepID=UPI003CCB9820